MCQWCMGDKEEMDISPLVKGLVHTNRTQMMLIIYNYGTFSYGWRSNNESRVSAWLMETLASHIGHNGGEISHYPQMKQDAQ